ncbi:uncharacterized protein LOC112686386 isoform X2 [Sipha flava]|uniref:Uncharacterized protein LOC112686386 isoform X2 n=1 Tax=Sipha flava TaxID=143950 RepID=A0A8B8FVJ9_9HEMI|nr:uncharacterized protein LOC112686386 isoform X2 [Sipha flava]
MKQKKKKDEQPSAADEQQQLCNGAGEPRPKKSALKRTATGSSSKATKSSKNKRHVQFNESLNVFFESDYVIVIRDDDCDFDEEDFDFWSQQPCSCGDESCFQPWLDNDDGRGRGLPPLDPYEEQPATLSPPDGYKDGCPRHVPPSLDHLKYDDDLTTRYNSDVMDHCNDTHVPYNPITNSAAYFDDKNQKTRSELSSPPRLSKDEQQEPLKNPTAVQVSKPNSVCDTNSSTAQQPRCIVETITMTTVTERQIVQETRPVDASSVDGPKTDDSKAGTGDAPATTNPDEGYVMIKCGNNTVLYNNRNPNSAVRQLFPATKFVCPPTRIKETDDARLLNKYLITEESLRAFDSRSMNGVLSGGGFKSEPHSDDDDDDTSNSLIRRTIERSTLRRNTSKKKNVNDTKEISLIEKIRRLTCDSDDDADDSANSKVVAKEQAAAYTVLVQCESMAPSTTTTTPTYKKLTELFGGVGSGGGGSGRHDQPLLPPTGPQQSVTGFGDPTGKPDALDLCDGHSATGSRAAVRSMAGGKPFLSTLATACVTGNVHGASSGSGGGGGSMPTTGLAQPSQCPQPDVVAGTQVPSSHRQEELAAFVQQDSGRLEKIRKQYKPPAAEDDDDDENDDYGFNRRPEVHGIRSGFSAQIMIKNNPQPPQRPRSYYGDPTRQPPPIEVQPDFVPRYPVSASAAAVRARVQGESRAPPPYPAASQRSIIRVTHGQQQQTIRVPYQAVGPVQVHLLTTAATTASNVGGHGSPHVQIRHPPNEYIVQHGHARIHHGQQFVIARGTQTAAISTTRYYQLPPPPPPSMQQQQLPQPQLPPQAFQPTDENSSAQFKLTSPTRGVAGSNRHVQQQLHQQQQEFADHNNLPPPVSQTPKNPVLFYGMNV